jgi:hypothetical protein
VTMMGGPSVAAVAAGAMAGGALSRVLRVWGVCVYMCVWVCVDWLGVVCGGLHANLMSVLGHAHIYIYTHATSTPFF